jgi:cytochrome c oxidase cbb3-type subunit 4
MSGLSYETVSRFAQQGGTLYFVLLFVAGCAYAFWPRNKEKFQHLANLPLQGDEGENV